MPYSIEAACRSGRGKIRGNNEDNFFFDGEIREEISGTNEKKLSFKCVKSGKAVFAVFDGMGGEANGEFASFVAAVCFRENLKIEKAEELCAILNNAVCDEAKEKKSRCMGTTIAMLSTDGENVTACNVGDSRIYYFSGGNLSQLSCDHVDHRRDGKKGSLTQHLGIPEEEMLIEPSVVTVGKSVGDIFLLCSDGLTDMLSDEDICRIMEKSGSSVTAANELYDAAMTAGGKDNITVITVKFI